MSQVPPRPGAVTGEAVTEVFFVRHQLRTTGIQRTFDENQGGGMQTEGDRMVNQEVTRANGQEQGVSAAVNRIQPAG